MSACRKVKLDESGKVVGWIPINTQPDYETVFPDRNAIFKTMSNEELLDEYNRPIWKLDIKKTVTGKEDDGSDMCNYTVAVKEDRVMPTAGEIEAKRIEKVNKTIEKQIPDMLRRGLTWDEMKIAARKIDETIKNE